nr:MAG TPA: hypothetical protein [Caudoviricetes sp.]
MQIDLHFFVGFQKKTCFFIQKKCLYLLSKKGVEDHP